MSAQPVKPLIVAVAAAVVAVGAFTGRTLVEAAGRLGLYWPAIRAYGAMVLAIFALVLSGFGFDLVGPPIVRAFGGEPMSAAEMQRLFSGEMGLLALVVMALVSGTTEELLFRGVLQPQLGLFVTSVLFAAVHGFQYRADALASVLVTGFVLGHLRDRHGLLAPVAVHVAYNVLALSMQP